jgi:hypothetical protein
MFPFFCVEDPPRVCHLLVVFLSFFFWSLYCLSFDLRLQTVQAGGWTVWKNKHIQQSIFLGVGQCYDKLVGILDSKLAQTRNLFCGSICLSRTGKYAATHANQKVYYTNLVSTFIFETWSEGIQWVSGWLLFNANSAIFQLHHGENKLILNEMMMRSALF